MKLDIQRYLHIIIVGRSILRNAYRDSDEYEELREYRGLLQRWSITVPGTPDDAEAGENAAPGSPIFKAVMEYVRSGPRRASAELNSFFGYLEVLDSYTRLGEKIVHDIALLSMDSGVNWFAARIIEEYLRFYKEFTKDWRYEPRKTIFKNAVGDIKTQRIKEFGRDFWIGLAELTAALQSIVSSSAGKYDRILLNLTGSHKPESSILMLVSGLIGIDAIYYLHEFMTILVEIPVLPIAPDTRVYGIIRRALEGEQLSMEEKELLKRLGLIRRDAIGPSLSAFAKVIELAITRSGLHHG